MVEEWLPVRDFPGHYEVSSLGRLRRTNAYHRNSVGKIRKPQISKAGYVVYMLSVENKVRLCSAHRLVADAFLGPIPPNMQVNHKNGDKSDPRLENLEIITNSANRAHSYQVLGIKPNKAVETNYNAKLTWDQVDELKAEYATGNTSHSRLAAKYGVCRMTILRILNNKTWREEDRPPRFT